MPKQTLGGAATAQQAIRSSRATPSRVGAGRRLIRSGPRAGICWSRPSSHHLSYWRVDDLVIAERLVVCKATRAFRWPKAACDGGGSAYDFAWALVTSPCSHSALKKGFPQHFLSLLNSSKFIADQLRRAHVVADGSGKSPLVKVADIL
ncbi:hypothetical protein L1887_53643 [Cichorium endivia]|nr:hypothetical protein L1887_53643 [Cichorium endivia]